MLIKSDVQCRSPDARDEPQYSETIFNVNNKEPGCAADMCLRPQHRREMKKMMDNSRESGNCLSDVILIVAQRERSLDQTLEETFPCSDPLSSIPNPLGSGEGLSETNELERSANQSSSSRCISLGNSGLSWRQIAVDWTTTEGSKTELERCRRLLRYAYPVDRERFESTGNFI